MANIKISELNPLLTVEDADVLPIVDNAITKKVTAAILRSYTQGNSVLLTGAQTVAGIKTFTSQLASSVATGTAPFSVASTTKVTNLNADLLDGLSSADFQATLGGTGIVKSTAGTISYLTDNSTNWNTAFNDSITSAGVTGTSTKTLTLNQQDGGTVTASWSDADTGLTSVGLSMPSAFTVANSPLTANGTLAVTGAGTTAQYVRGDGSLATFPSLTGFVPYTGATTNVDLGTHSLTASDLVINHASGSGVAASITKGGNGEALTVVKSSGSGNAASITGGTTLISELNLTTDLADAYIASAATWNAKQNAITLTTTGTSGAATLVGATLNIPQYQSVLTNPITGTGTTNYLPKFTGASALGDSNLISNSAGNLGLGVVPTTSTVSKFIQFGAGAALSTNSTNNSNFWHNTTFDASGNGLYAVTGQQSSFYRQINGAHRWYYAAAGTAGNAITFTEHMALDSLGQLLIGTATSSTFKLDVNGTARVVGSVTTNSASGFRLDSAGSILFSLGYSGGTLLDRLTGTSFRIAESGTPQLTIATGGAATFVADATINGVKVGRGAGNIATNTAVGAGTLDVNTTGANNTALGVAALSLNTTASNNTAIGTKALQFNTASNNTAVGFETALFNTSGSVTAIGYRALRANTTGASNTAVGNSALASNSTAADNTAVGASALLTNTTGVSNTGIGLNALALNSVGSSNTAIGRGSLQNNTASNNTAVGFEAAYTNTSATGITAIGYQSLKANTTGANNTALGFTALAANTTGIQNTALGSQSLSKNTTGISNIGIGLSALLNNLTGNSNIAIGVESLLNSTGNNNIAIGTSALSLNTAANNTALGFEAAKVNTTGTGITAIGYQSLVANTGSQNTAIGFLSLNGNIGGNSNTAIGSQTVSGNFDASVIIGRAATATASNQFVVGSASYPAGAVATETNTSSKVWNVIINGVAQKILLA